MTEHLAPKDIIHFAVAAAVADSNHDQEWGLIKSGKGEETKRREEEEPQFATGAHFLCGTKGRNYETGVGSQSESAAVHLLGDKNCTVGLLTVF